MAKGLPKSIIAKYGISKKAWEVYRGTKGRVSKAIRHRKRKAYKPKRTYRSSVRHMVRRRARRRARSFLSFGTMSKFIKIGALVAPAAASAFIQGATPYGKISNALEKYTGYSIERSTFNPAMLLQGWGPFIVTSLVVTGVQKLNGIVRRL